MGQTAHTYEEALIGLDGSAIAMAAWDGGSGCHLKIKNEADASLIAASPALYDACEVAFDFLGSIDGAAEVRDTLLSAMLAARGGEA
jgi:hypothetical protein